MLTRDRIERDYAPLFERYGYGITIWSPLASGILSGKYNGNKIPEGSRMDTAYGMNIDNNYKKKYGDGLYEKLDKLADFAKEVGCSQAQLCLLWAISNKDVTTCILGASKPQ